MWERRDQNEDEAKKAANEDAPPAQEKANDKWEKAAGKMNEDREQADDEDLVILKDKEGNATPDAAEASHKPPITTQNKVACEICGLFNHATKDCRRMICEICGYNNHTAYDCRRCVLWNTGPKLCAAQVEDQSFFFIKECIDPRLAKEKENICVISILRKHRCHFYSGRSYNCQTD